MKNGQILVAYDHGVNVIRMLGDVRLTLCISFDNFISQMFEARPFEAVIFDLREATCIDSTTLGLMAKIAITSEKAGFKHPLVLTASLSINRLLETMGFCDIFELVQDAELPKNPETILNVSECGCDDEEQVKMRVLEAHRILMQLNTSNQNQFKALVDALENQ
jgi:anti-anti-sigma regulatory factor